MNLPSLECLLMLFLVLILFSFKTKVFFIKSTTGIIRTLLLPSMYLCFFMIEINLRFERNKFLCTFFHFDAQIEFEEYPKKY